MIGEMIQEYLVGLGVQIDKPGFDQANKTINTLTGTIEQATGSWAKNFTRASGIVGAAMASLAAGSLGLMKAAAGQDLAMEKLSRQMMVTKESAWAMKKATDALGESIQDIYLTPELLDRFKQLTREGGQMQVGGDFKETMKSFRDLTFEFTRLKQEVSYAMTWVGYYLMKYLNKPLTEAREKFRSFNDSFIKNMSVWTEKAAKALAYLVTIGAHTLEFILTIGKAIGKLWLSFPAGVKIATAALAVLWAVIKATPLGRMIMLVSTLMLLIDDYFGYMEGKQAQFGAVWDILNQGIDLAKEKFEEFKAFILPFWERFKEFASEAGERIIEFGKDAVDTIERVGSSHGFQTFLAVVVKLGKAIFDLAVTVGSFLLESITDLYEKAEKSGAIDQFKQIIERLGKALTWLIDTIGSLINFVKDVLEEFSRTEEVEQFREAIAELWAAGGELLNTLFDLVEIIFPGLFKNLGKHNEVIAFRDVLRLVLAVVNGILGGVTWLIKKLSELFKMMRDSSTFRKFWETLGSVIDSALTKLGKFGRALIKLVDGDFKGAWDIVNGSDKEANGGYDPNVNARAKEAWQAAKQIGEKYDVDPKLIYAQWYHESGGFESELAQENNYGGIKGATNVETGHDNKGHSYFATPQDFFDYYSRIWGPYIKGAHNVEEFLDKLQKEGYFTDDRSIYKAGVKGGLQHIPEPVADEGTRRGRIDISTYRHGNLRKWSSTEGDNTPWSHNDVTDTAHFQLGVASFLQDLNDAGEKHGITFTITGGAEKGYHAKGTHSHETGDKVDISDANAPKGSEAWQILMDVLSNYDYKINHEADKGHYDIVILPASDVGGFMPTAYTGGTGSYSILPLMANGADALQNVLSPLGGVGAMQNALAPLGDAAQTFRENLPQLDGNLPAPDPLLMGGLLGGERGLGSLPSPLVSNISYVVNVGGVTVEGGANASAADIGRSVGDEIMQRMRLERSADFLLNSGTLAGARYNGVGGTGSGFSV